MSIVSSYGVEVLSMNRIFEPTIKIFREAIAFCIAALENEWDNISAIAKAQPRFNYCEHMLHGTAKNKAKYGFDVLFYKMPCYFRRAVVKAALGALESYHSNLEKWELDKQGKKPRLQADRFAMPCFYKDNMFLPEAGDGYCALKLYINREHSTHNVGSFWAYARRLNDEIARKVAIAVTEFAAINGCDVIVFEFLDMRGKKLRGSKKQKLLMWKKNAIQELVQHKAHRLGIRISHICPWGTSALAFDGSGRLTRNEDNHALATFANGKQYNCDLSASYNIGARYFIREIYKTLPVTVRSQLEAKVPEAARRTSCTYATLRSVIAELNAA